VEVSDGIYDLYESGYRDSAAITASVASKLVHQRNEITLVSASATPAIVVEPAAIKSKITRHIPTGSTAGVYDNFIIHSIDETVVDEDLSVDVDQNV
jgi:hypothetical protein